MHVVGAVLMPAHVPVPRQDGLCAGSQIGRPSRKGVKMGDQCIEHLP